MLVETSVHDFSSQLVMEYSDYSESHPILKSVCLQRHEAVPLEGVGAPIPSDRPVQNEESYLQASASSSSSGTGLFTKTGFRVQL